LTSPGAGEEKVKGKTFFKKRRAAEFSIV